MAPPGGLVPPPAPRPRTAYLLAAFFLAPRLLADFFFAAFFFAPFRFTAFLRAVFLLAAFLFLAPRLFAAFFRDRRFDEAPVDRRVTRRAESPATRHSAAQVPGPTTPSTLSPSFCWKVRTARSVSCPNSPSTCTTTPAAFSSSCSCSTSGPLAERRSTGSVDRAGRAA